MGNESFFSFFVHLRANVYAGPQERELGQILGAKVTEVDKAKVAWKKGAGALFDLEMDLKTQQKRILDDYTGKGGEGAAAAYGRVIKLVADRRAEMETMSAALEHSEGVLTQAVADFTKLPSVRPPFDGAIPPKPTALGAKKLKPGQKSPHEKALDAKASQDSGHEADKAAAEREAGVALIRARTGFTEAADKMRPVAGMEKPPTLTNPHTTADTAPADSGMPGRHSGPGVIDAGPKQGNPGNPGTPGNPSNPSPTPGVPHPDTTGPGPDATIPNPDQSPGPDNDGDLLGPGPTKVGPGPTIGNPGPTTISPPGSTGPGTPGPGGPGMAPPVGTGRTPGASARPTPGNTLRPVPGRNGIGRTPTPGSRGVIGRNGLTPGQSTSGRPGASRGAGTGTRGLTSGQSTGGRSAPGSRGAAGTRGLTSGQSTGTRGSAGARGGTGARGSAGTRGVAGSKGTAGGRNGLNSGQSTGRGSTGRGPTGRGSSGRGGKRDREESTGSSFLQDESQWLDDDETGPSILD